MRLTLFLCFWLGTITINHAKNDTIDFRFFKTEVQDHFKTTLKLDVTGLINPFKTSTGVIADFAVHRAISLDVGLGTYLHSNESSSLKGEMYLGVKTGIGIKHWTGAIKGRGFYWGALLEGNYINNKTYRDILRQGQFIQRDLVNRNILSTSLVLRFGYQLLFGPDQRFVFEQFWGLGVLLYNINIIANFEGEINRGFPEFWSFELDERDNAFPYGYLLGINLGYKIR